MQIENAKNWNLADYNIFTMSVDGTIGGLLNRFEVHSDESAEKAKAEAISKKQKWESSKAFEGQRLVIVDQKGRFVH